MTKENTLTFNYVNDLGFNKIIIIFLDEVDENGRYKYQLWAGYNGSMETTGTYCGSGGKNKEELNEFFEHYKIDYKFN